MSENPRVYSRKNQKEHLFLSLENQYEIVKFLSFKGKSAAVIHRRLMKTIFKKALSESSLRERCKGFKKMETGVLKASDAAT